MWIVARPLQLAAGVVRIRGVRFARPWSGSAAGGFSSAAAGGFRIEQVQGRTSSTSAAGSLPVWIDLSPARGPRRPHDRAGGPDRASPGADLEHVRGQVLAFVGSRARPRPDPPRKPPPFCLDPPPPARPGPKKADFRGCLPLFRSTPPQGGRFQVYIMPICAGPPRRGSAGLDAAAAAGYLACLSIRPGRHGKAIRGRPGPRVQARRVPCRRCRSHDRAPGPT